MPTYRDNENHDFRQNQLQNVVIHKRPVPPPKPVEGQVYYNNQTNTLELFDGNRWQSLAFATPKAPPKPKTEKPEPTPKPPTVPEVPTHVPVVETKPLPVPEVPVTEVK